MFLTQRTYITPCSLSNLQFCLQGAWTQYMIDKLENADKGLFKHVPLTIYNMVFVENNNANSIITLLFLLYFFFKQMTNVYFKLCQNEMTWHRITILLKFLHKI